jgi:hypothetical protein
MNRKSLSDLLFEADDLIILTAREFLLGNMASRKTIVFVGGGPLPVSPILYSVFLAFKAIHPLRCRYLFDVFEASLSKVSEENKFLSLLRSELPPFVREELSPQQSVCRVLSLDKSERATQSACLLLAKSDLTGLIEPTHADGCDFRLELSPDLVLLASMANPKAEILTHLLSFMKHSGGDFLIRSVGDGDLRQILYEPFSFDEISKLQERFSTLVHKETWRPGSGSHCINSVIALSVARSEQA